MAFLDKVVKKTLTENQDKDFCELIKALRMCVGMRQSVLGGFIGVTPARICYLEQGLLRTMPSKEEIAGYHKVFGVEPKFLEVKAFQHISKYIREPLKSYLRDATE